MSESDSAELNRRDLMTRLAGIMLLTGASTGSEKVAAGGHTMPEFVGYPPSDPKLFNEIDAVLKRTEAIWLSQEWWRLPEEIWDREDPTPIYVAEELYNVMVGWDTLDRYIFPPSKGLDAFRWGYSNLFVKYLAPGVALALYDHWFEIKIRAPGPIGNPRHGFDRVLSIYNKRSDGWRQSLYAQCPLGPDTNARRMAEKLVGDDWDEFYEDVKRKEIQDPRLNRPIQQAPQQAPQPIQQQAPQSIPQQAPQPVQQPSVQQAPVDPRKPIPGNSPPPRVPPNPAQPPPSGPLPTDVLEEAVEEVPRQLRGVPGRPPDM